MWLSLSSAMLHSSTFNKMKNKQLLGGRKHLDSGGDINTSATSSPSDSPGSSNGESETSAEFARKCQLEANRALSSARHFQQKLGNELHFIESFPTQRAQRFARISGNTGISSGAVCLDWRDLKEIGDILPRGHLQRALETKDILLKIVTSLDIPGSGEIEPDLSSQFHPFFLENLGFAKQREVEYAALFLRKNLSKEEVQWRDVQMSWIVKASREFKTEVETTFIASYYVDAFLHRKRVNSPEEMEALAYAAFFAATKLEEVEAVELNDLFDKFFSLLRFHKKTVVAMELEMLSVLRFNSCPPTVKYMLDAALSRKSINFLVGTESHIEDLAMSLLLMSLQEANFSRIKSSTKVLLALEVASEFVMYHFDEGSTYSQDYRIREKPILPKTMLNGCYGVFSDLLRQKVLEL